MTICIYGTVYNNVNTVEESIKSVFDPSYDIVIVDNYSKDGTWEKLQELKKDYNLTLLRLKSSRGKGRAYALEHCPENSITAYFDLDTYYNENFHKVIKSGLKELLILGPMMSYIQSKDQILKIGNWKNLNYGEDIEFLSRQKISITFPLIIGENQEIKAKNLYIERERRYTKLWRIRLLKNVINIYRSLNIQFKDLVLMYPYTKKYILILMLLDVIARIKGKYKNANVNNYVYFFKKAINTVVDPTQYLNVNTRDTQISISKNIYDYLRSYNAIDDSLIGKYILLV
ncbi:glycosyltransferase [Acidianus manzaensis]|uniref:Glycosyltransferase 2-like domain-containing protein n=1 Tax=Acidianus manzaensis TaxID=282676 RepID=A0A1W6K0Y1_9CREN|nr:glycosyltransferase family 2 protein [Acidianus manzaensis]ARM76130.1 hypothetical protein B6F84_08930 [Acidianus manzaensis]